MNRYAAGSGPKKVSALVAAFGAELDDVVGGSDDVGVVLDDDDSVAAVEEGAEGGEEFLDVVEVEACGGLVEDEEDGLVGGPAFVSGVLAEAEEVGELDALALAAAEGAAVLAEGDVAEADVVQGHELGGDAGGGGLAGGGEEFDGFVYAHVEHVADVLAAVADFEHVLDEAFAAAGLAGHDDVGHELHGYLDCALAETFGAAASVDVEGEMGVAEAVDFGQRLLGEELADVVVGLDVGHGVGAGAAAYRILVHELDRGYAVQVTAQLPERAGSGSDLVDHPVEGRVEDIAHEGGLARAADSDDGGHDIERKAHIDVLEVVLAGIADFDVLLPGAFDRVDGNLLPAQQIF